MPPPDLKILILRGNFRRRTRGRLCGSGECLNKPLTHFNALQKLLKGRYSHLARMVGLGKGGDICE